MGGLGGGAAERKRAGATRVVREASSRCTVQGSVGLVTGRCSKSSLKAPDLH